MTEMTQDEIGLCVVEIREQIRAADPDAYRARFPRPGDGEPSAEAVAAASSTCLTR